MATVTADASQDKSRPDPTRRLWQVPVFVLGVVAFIAAYNGWLPLGPTGPDGAYRRDLMALKSAVEKLPLGPGELRDQLKRIAGDQESFPDDAPLAHFVLGSGYVRLAELATDPSEARGFWGLAREHFSNVRESELSGPEDQVRLMYRAAKARAADLPANTPPSDIDLTRQRLMLTPPGEDPGEAQRLAADLCLRLVPPDLKRAQISLTEYLREAGPATPRVSVTRARARLGEVLRQLGDFDGAKKWLSQIERDAPPDVIPTAKSQLARIRMAERDWSGAAKEWEQVRTATAVSPDLRVTSTYQLGVCRLLARPADPVAAAQLLEEVAKSDGPESAAAAVQLTKLRIQGSDPVKHLEAADLLNQSAKRAIGPGDDKGGPLPVAEVRVVFEQAISVLVADGAFGPASEVARAYRTVAEGGRDQARLADVSAAWADAEAKAGRDATGKYATAADAFNVLAEARPAGPDKAALYQRAAALYRKAGQPALAITSLKHAIAVNDIPDEVVGALWADYADLLLQGNAPGAIEAFLIANQEVLNRAGPGATKARLGIARCLMGTRDQKMQPFAIALLEQIAEKNELTPDERESHEQALLQLGHAKLQQDDCVVAEARLRTLGQLYPIGSEAVVGRFLLGVCLVQRGKPDLPGMPKVRSPALDRGKALKEALGLFQGVIDELKRRRQEGPLATRDEWVYTQAKLRIPQTYYWMGKYNDVLLSTAQLQQEFRGRVEELIVLSYMWLAFKGLNEPERMLQARSQIVDLYTQIKDKPGVFSSGIKEYTREFWEQWLNTSSSAPAPSGPAPGPAPPTLPMPLAPSR